MSQGQITENELSPELMQLIQESAGKNQRVYYGVYDDLGFDKADFSDTDLMGNLFKIIERMERGTMLLSHFSYGIEHPLTESLKLKFKDELAIIYNDKKDFSVRITTFGNVNMPSLVEIMPNQEHQVFTLFVDRGGSTDYMSRLTLTSGKGTDTDPIELQSNDDFNNFKRPFCYNVGTTAIAKTIKNIPVQLGGALRVVKTLDEINPSCLQIYTAYTAASITSYRRTYYDFNKKWSAWEQDLTVDTSGFLTSPLRVKGLVNTIELRPSSENTGHGLQFSGFDGTRLFEIQSKSNNTFYTYDNANSHIISRYNTANQGMDIQVSNIRAYTIDGKKSSYLAWFEPHDTSGFGGYFETTGLFVIGGGEGATTFRTNFMNSEVSDIATWNHATENIVLYADGQVNIYTYGQSWANRKRWEFTNAGNVITPGKGIMGGTHWGTAAPAASLGIEGDIYIQI